MERLVGLSAAKATRLYGAVYPRVFRLDEVWQDHPKYGASTYDR